VLFKNKDKIPVGYGLGPFGPCETLVDFMGWDEFGGRY
jgi:hypothetical protein